MFSLRAVRTFFIGLALSGVFSTTFLAKGDQAYGTNKSEAIALGGEAENNRSLVAFKLNNAEAFFSRTEVQNGRGPVVFIVNGFGGCSSGNSGGENCILSILYEKLKEKGITVFYADWNDLYRRSTFGSDKKLLEDFKSAINDVPSDRPIILIGHSFGADSVLKVANDKVYPRRIAYLAILDGVGKYGFRTTEEVRDNVDYFYNKWTAYPASLTIAAGMPWLDNLTPLNKVITVPILGQVDKTGQVKCRANKNGQSECHQYLQSNAKREDGSTINNLLLAHGATFVSSATGQYISISEDRLIQQQMFDSIMQIDKDSKPQYWRGSEERFRISNRIANTSGFIGGFPNFEQGGSNRNPVYGTVLINPEAAVSKDIPISEINNPKTFEDRFRAVQGWATSRGFVGAFPNFEQGNGVYGAILIKSEAGLKVDVPISTLGNPRSNEERFIAVNRYATNNGYAAGFPDFNQADYGQGTVLGVVLIKKGSAIKHDVSLDETIAMRLTGDIPRPTTTLKLSTRQTNTTPNTRQATSSNPIATSFPPAKGLTEGQVLERLSSIPVFVIVDDRNNPLLVDSPQQSNKQVSFYLGTDEAEVMLNQVKTANPDIGNKAKIITRRMNDIYQFIRQNKGKNVAFKFVSKRSNIEAARSILAAQGKPINQVPEVPVFFATVQRANGQRLLTVDGNGGKIVPIFFDKRDLEGLLNRNRETVQKIINIQVASLFQVLDSMVTKNNQPNPEVELFQFVPSGAALVLREKE
ncbi:MAG: hypothetical protein M1G31_13915 [Pseudanabaena sp. Salubria-1]|nr:hypothetical protein [Pseudanabaena sp. Salubria-1]